jgi:asparagine synthase (glutamine-hydrolysing)
MCGICGIISFNKKPIELNQLKKMTDIIAHRGPDGEGHWLNENNSVALGHRRLSIIDLSHDADQPMHYLQNRFTIVFNGEIYNYIELKESLVKQGYSFKTQSDTEVLMALYHKYNKECLQLLDGMFAFAIYDNETQEIFIARDRFGEKPFFYSYKPDQYFYFGSEMKCLWAGGIQKEVNDEMMFNYLNFSMIENFDDLSETFYNNITRLPHSHYIIINLNSNEFKLIKYYDINISEINNSISFDKAKEMLKELMYTSIKRRLRSDVTVGSSLSGGLDSSLVVGIIDKLKVDNQKQDTFSAVFPGFEKDESKFINIALNHSNVNSHFITPSDEGLINDIDKLSWHQEEPYLSSSIYVQYCVMQAAKKNNVTVLLDGQGADEILAGYHVYYQSFFNQLKNENKENYLQQFSKYNKLHQYNKINGIYSKSIGDRIRSISPELVKPVKIIKNYYSQLSSPIFNKDFFNEFKAKVFSHPGGNFKTLNESLYSSTFKLGLQQLLRYADRNSMAHSIEVRLPFLNHELIDFLFTLPANYKINNGWTKYIMRETFNTELPTEIAWRKDKIGYEPPQKKWMESEAVKETILKNRKKLVDNNYLHKNILSKPINASDACNPNENSWTHWMAGNIL